MNPDSTGKTAVAVAALALRRGDRSLFREMTWQIPVGSLLAVTGVSGAGKSSLIGCLAGIVEPDVGECRLDPSDSRLVGLIFQDFRLAENLSVIENVVCGRLGAYNWRQTLFSLPWEEKTLAFPMLKDLGLGKLVHRRVSKISGGEKQRTAIARTLFQKPAIILADEPTSNLDAELANRVMRTFRETCRLNQTTVIMVVHDDRMVSEFADYQLTIDPQIHNGWRFEKVS